MTTLDTTVARKREIALSREQWRRNSMRVSGDSRTTLSRRGAYKNFAPVVKESRTRQRDTRPSGFFSVGHLVDRHKFWALTLAGRAR